MKKRLLALALCLVMVTSLLPLTAAAEDVGTVNSVIIAADGVESNKYGYSLRNLSFIVKSTIGEFNSADPNYTASSPLFTSISLNQRLNDPPKDGGTYFVDCRLRKNPEMGVLLPLAAGNIGNSIDLCISGFQASFEGNNFSGNDGYGVRICLTKVHDWKFTVSENNDTLTAQCQNQDCRKEMSVSLKADSVTLPGSPFNAQVILNGITEEEIKKEFRYEISPIRYKFKAPGDSAFTEITPADGAREGTYQAAVTLSPIEVAARYARNDDGTTQGLVTEPDGSITLYTQYTAVNPETTAQTGDYRPIELMMGSVVVFSALAAAAFILDSKRRSQQ